MRWSRRPPLRSNEVLCYQRWQRSVRRDLLAGGGSILSVRRVAELAVA